MYDKQVYRGAEQGVFLDRQHIAGHEIAHPAILDLRVIHHFQELKLADNAAQLVGVIDHRRAADVVVEQKLDRFFDRGVGPHGNDLAVHCVLHLVHASCPSWMVDSSR
jgi:hypothetical protein